MSFKTLNKYGSISSILGGSILTVIKLFGVCSMGDIIQFPQKEKFINKYAANLPDDIKECLSLAYDEALKDLNRIPTVEFTVSGDQIEKMTNFKNEYKTTMIELISKILNAKAEICTLKAGL